MTSRTVNRRFAYVKFNDAVAEFQRVEANKGKIPDGGPDAYVANFLAIADSEPVLIASFHVYPPGHRYVARNNRTVESLFWRHGFSIATIFRRTAAVVRLFWLLYRFKPTHALVWETRSPLWAAFLTCRLTGSRFVVSRHGRFPLESDPWHRRLVGALDKVVVRWADAVVCHGPYLREETLAIGVPEDRIYEFNWSYGTMLESFRRSSEGVASGDPNQKMVLFIGRIFSLKGIFDLLWACSQLIKRGEPVSLVYAGDGPDFAALEEAIRSQELARHVKVLGRIDHDELGRWIEAAHVVCTPTRAAFPEGRCMAAIEGLIMGKPVIAPDFGPFPYLIKDGENGLLYRPDDRSDLLDKLAQVLRDEGIYSRLRVGADTTRCQLLLPTRTFRPAVEAALAL